MADCVFEKKLWFERDCDFESEMISLVEELRAYKLDILDVTIGDDSTI